MYMYTYTLGIAVALASKASTAPILSSAPIAKEVVKPVTYRVAITVKSVTMDIEVGFDTP